MRIALPVLILLATSCVIRDEQAFLTRLCHPVTGVDPADEQCPDWDFYEPDTGVDTDTDPVCATAWADGDGDGFGDPDVKFDDVCDPLTSGEVRNSDDCDDSDANAKPGNTESCDGVDNDCDGNIDEALVTRTHYADADGDSFGDPASAIETCMPTPSDRVEEGGDCDDSSSDVYPGASELCDDVDQDCDGDASPSEDDVEEAIVHFADADRDGYGDPDTAEAGCGGAPSDRVAVGGDCDDSTDQAHPGITEETCNDGVDNDCDGTGNSCTWTGANGVRDSSELILFGQNGGNIGSTMRLANIDGDPADELVVAEHDADPTERIWFFHDVLNGVTGPASSQPDLWEINTATNVTGIGGAMDFGDIDGDGVLDLFFGKPRQGTGLAYIWTQEKFAQCDPACEVESDYTYRFHANLTAMPVRAGSGVAFGELDDTPGLDMAISARTADWIVDDEGTVYIVTNDQLVDFNRANNNSNSLASESRTQIHGHAPETRLETVAICDIDGDGDDNMLLGAPVSNLATHGGLLAGYDEIPTGTTNEVDGATRFIEAPDGDSLGSDLTCADLDGDGINEAIAGNSQEYNSAEKGEVVAYSGVNFLTIFSAPADITFEGRSVGGHFGEHLATGDFDADGTTDIAVTAPMDDTDEAQSGAVFLFYGPFGAGSYSASADAGARFSGDDDTTPWRLREIAAGNLDNASGDDLVIQGSAADRIFVILGRGI